MLLVSGVLGLLGPPYAPARDAAPGAGPPPAGALDRGKLPFRANLLPTGLRARQDRRSPKFG
ncbi:hypothetical protein GCM10011578_101450 [Streptomyces fuscichromogenes]|uniref:Uncharacterized protein n=1 Tax=Streptomyces fuscichromogenes TaxID=1324013 RepID=A0A917XPP4_9ACTN|nr:hypothetical protein GCM10011578_101450 [Streptomyces fuscichromogenes]